jgi:hypothetical protein
MKKALFLLIASMLAVSLGILISQWRDGDDSLDRFVWMLWPISSYALMAVIAWLARTRAALVGTLVVCAVAGFLGLWMILDVFYIHPDPQSPIALLFMPAIQLAILIVVGLPLLLALNCIKDNGGTAAGSQAS